MKLKNVINKHKSNKIKENSNTVRHLNNGTDHRHSKSCCDQSSPARRTIKHLQMKSSDELQRLDYMTGYQYSSPSNGHQGDIPYYMRLYCSGVVELCMPWMWIPSDHFVDAPSLWETTLQCNVVSHWLGAFTKWSLNPSYFTTLCVCVLPPLSTLTAQRLPPLSFHPSKLHPFPTPTTLILPHTCQVTLDISRVTLLTWPPTCSWFAIAHCGQLKRPLKWYPIM